MIPRSLDVALLNLESMAEGDVLEGKAHGQSLRLSSQVHAELHVSWCPYEPARISVAVFPVVADVTADLVRTIEQVTDRGCQRGGRSRGDAESSSDDGGGCDAPRGEILTIEKHAAYTPDS